MTFFVTEHSPHHFRVYDDFTTICTGDLANACILHMYEDLYKDLARELIKKYQIPAGLYPAIADMWIDEMDLRAAEKWTSRVRSRSTYARTLHDANPPHQPPSLIQLGYLRSRFIARYRPGAVTRIATAVYQDEQRRLFIIVQNRNGLYIDDSGERCCARAQGWEIVKQYLYDADKVNIALEKAKPIWSGELSQPLPRHAPLVAMIKKEGAAQRTAKSSHSATSNMQEIITPESGTTLPYGDKGMHTFDSEHSTSDGAAASAVADNSNRFQKSLESSEKLHKLYRTAVDVESLRVSPWIPETLLGLASLRLPIPARPPDEDAEALRKWLANWWEPTQRLYMATCDLPPQIAWEHIDLTIQYMDTPGSPSWWQRGPESGLDFRKTRAPITLRNVADHFVIQWDDYLKQRAWSAGAVIPYDGPPLEEVEEEPGQLLTVNVSQVDDDQEMQSSIEEAIRPGDGQEACTGFPPNETGLEPTTDEIPVPLIVQRRRKRGMNRGAAENLADDVAATYPGLFGQIDEFEPGCHLLTIFYGDGEADYFTLDWPRWWNKPPEIEQGLTLAVQYANRIDGGGGSSPPESETVREYDAAL